MKSFWMVSAALIFCFLSLVGCGGGGGGSSAGPAPAPTPTPATTKIAGVASKAPIGNATVSAYKIVNGAKAELLDSGSTAADGSYSLNLGAYTGPVFLEISGGTYIDEATGANTTLATPLHAVVSSTSGTVSAAITPLTELAYQQAGSSLTPTTIDAANKKVSDIFKVSDIIKVQPVAPTSAALAALPSTIQGQDQRDYTLVLATFSQLASSQSQTVAATVTQLNGALSGNTLNPTVATALQNAATNYFSASNSNNKTGITSPALTNLVYIGARTAVVKLATKGSLPAGKSIYGVETYVTMPAGISVKSDTNGVFSTYLLSSGLTPTANSYISGTVSGNVVKIILGLQNSGGMQLGEFATLNCDVANNAVAPGLAGFTITGTTVSVKAPGGLEVGPTNTASVEVSSVTIK